MMMQVSYSSDWQWSAFKVWFDSHPDSLFSLCISLSISVSLLYPCLPLSLLPFLSRPLLSPCLPTRPLSISLRCSLSFLDFLSLLVFSLPLLVFSQSLVAFFDETLSLLNISLPPLAKKLRSARSLTENPLSLSSLFLLSPCLFSPSLSLSPCLLSSTLPLTPSQFLRSDLQLVLRVSCVLVFLYATKTILIPARNRRLHPGVLPPLPAHLGSSCSPGGCGKFVKIDLPPTMLDQIGRAHV